MTLRRSLLLLASLGCTAAAASAQQESRVFLRGGEPAFDTPITSISIEGVRYTLGSKQAILGWDRVDHIEGPAAPDFEPFQSIAADIWRARARIERRDYAGAEPLLEALADRFSMKPGPSAAVVHAGLLRCRVERGASISAVIPWLHYVASGDESLAAASVLTVGELGAVLVDPELNLAPDLPPMWLDTPPTQALSRAAWPRAAGESSQAAQPTSAQQRALSLGELYSVSLRYELGETVTMPRVNTGSDAGLQLVRDIVAARVGTDDQRTQARAALIERTKKSLSAWTRAWISAAVGRSLIREIDPEQQLLGIGYLLEVPATAPDNSPNLTGLCLAQAAATLAALGELEGAQRLRQELVSTLPGHPAIEWGPIRRINSQKPPVAQPATTTPSSGGPP